jgi:integrase
LVATLVFSGLQIGEARALECREVDLANGRLKVRGTETEATLRTVRLLPVLRDELAALKADRSPEARDRVFATSTGGALSEPNA